MLRLVNLWKIYKPSKDVTVTALKEINLEIKNNDFVAILGSSGSGKSTLLYQLGLLEKPTRGEVFVKEQKVSQLSDAAVSYLRNQTIGFIFQQFNLIPKLSVLDNVLLPTAYTKNGITKDRQNFARKLLTDFGISEKASAKPNQLSGGQQQRVAVARALVNQPEVIIADEPTGNLDSHTGIQIMELIKSIHEKEKKTIILVTHDQAIAEYAHRVVQIKDGQIV
jgi:putative ABC transport system ATP-binding protein